MKIQTLITALVLAASGAAFAQPTPAAVKDPVATPRLDQRQANQQKRIDQGVASGQLNARETRRLEKREAKLQADKQAVKVTPQERKQLQHEANRDSQAIYRQKHDRQVAAPAK